MSRESSIDKDEKSPYFTRSIGKSSRRLSDSTKKINVLGHSHDLLHVIGHSHDHQHNHRHLAHSMPQTMKNSLIVDKSPIKISYGTMNLDIFENQDVLYESYERIT